jgi:chromosome partitioning protein
MTHVLAVANQKGGVGKTTTTLNLGANLAARGRRVLVVDIDPQGNLTQGLGVQLDNLAYSIYEVLLNPEKGAGFAIVRTASGVDLLPATLDLAGAEAELAGHVGRELLLREALNQVHDAYDFILIDSPPNLGLFTLNALAAATSVLVPLQVHVYALKAIPTLEKTIALVRKLNPPLAIGGILVTQYDRRTNLSQVIAEESRRSYGALVFKTVIPFNTRLAEAPAAGEPISQYDPRSPGAVAYRDLAEEVERRYGNETQTD